MRRYSDISQIDREQWQQFIASSPTASWFQSPEAYDFYASLPELFEPFVCAVGGELSEGEENTSLRALCVGYITREANVLKHFFTRRAIIYAGPLLAQDAAQSEVECLLETIVGHVGHRAIYIESRNFHDFSRWKDAFAAAGFGYRPHYDMFIECDSQEAMLQRMQDGKRRQINKAIQEGVELKETMDAKDVDSFYHLLSALYRKKVKTPLYPISFFRLFVKNKVGKLFVVKHHGDVIGGMLCPIYTDAIRPERSTIYEWFVVGDVASTWVAMWYASQKGIATLDLMGAGELGVPYGVRDFKLSMGGQLAEYGRYQKVLSPLLYKLGKLGVKILKHNTK